MTMSHRLLLSAILFTSLCNAAETSVLADWENPPLQAHLKAYWWWLNGNVDKAAITRDLEQMKAKGFGGALICDADGSSQDGNARAPHGPTFFSPAWRELYRHALREANRLGLELSLNIQSGWNLGGPMVKAEDAPKKLAWSEASVRGGASAAVKLAPPVSGGKFYRDICVLAFPARVVPAKRPPIKSLAEKALLKPLHFSAPETAFLFQQEKSVPGEEDTRTNDVIDLTAKLAVDGTLAWAAQAGDWRVIRFGYTLNDHCRVSTCSQGWDGYAVDPFDSGAFTHYWDAVVAPLIADAEEVAKAEKSETKAGALRYLHTDSWEVEVANWTPTFREEFKARRGYDLFPWLPVIAGKIVNSREESNRFLNDFRRTFGDLAIDNHYRIYKARAHEHGILIHPESGGPHAVPIDAQQCLGYDDAPMSEFWAWSWTHRVGDPNRFFVKQPASAAHTYGRPLVLAEGFTTIGPHWQERIWNNLKPSFDHALTEGLNVLVWHAFVCTPASEGLPGQQYFAGTHLNPNVTWWDKSKPFFDYINRCQAMLQRGHFTADALYYYGDHVPNFSQLKASDPAHVMPGYDYDVVTADRLIDAASVHDGRITLVANGSSYRVLVLPDRDRMPLPVLEKIRDLVASGMTVIGSRPVRGETLSEGDSADTKIAELSGQLWGKGSENKFGKGRVITGKTAREVLQADGIPADCQPIPDNNDMGYIHRTDGETEIYFIHNRSTNAVEAAVAFRVSGKAAELWNPVSGERVPLASTPLDKSRTQVKLDFPPCGSWFVVFQPGPVAKPASEGNLERAGIIAGPWAVRFGTDAAVRFDTLCSWTARPEPAIRYFSGTAVYEATFEASPAKRTVIDLGEVRELAEVKVNGKSCGILWCPPWRTDITAALRPGKNQLQVEVVNFWPNRLIGDASLPPAQRTTRTNVRAFKAKSPLIPSGLMGPVVILADKSKNN